MPRHNDISGLTNINLVSQFKTGLAPSRPWDSIVDFATHPSFCGQAPYPKQLTILKMIYLETENMTAYDIDTIEEWRKGFGVPGNSVGVPEDIWERIKYLKENGYRRFTKVLSVMGRRAGKGWLGGVLGAESIAHMIALGNWQDHYGIQPHKDCYAHFMATTLPQAMKHQFSDVKDVVTQCDWLKPWMVEAKDHALTFRTPADVAYIAELQARKQKIDYEIATVRAIPLSSNSASGRGASVFLNGYDEFAHLLVGTGGPRASEELYNAHQPSLTQFGKDAFTYIPSSPFSKVGQFYNLYVQGSTLMPHYVEEKGIEVKKTLAKDLDEDAEEAFIEYTSDPSMLVLQLPSWVTYEDWDRSYELTGIRKTKAFVEYSDDLKRQEATNRTRFKVEYRAQFAEVEDPYLESFVVDRIFEPWHGKNLGPLSHGDSAVLYHGHADPGRTNANYAMAIGHLENGFEPDDRGNVWPHVVIDFMKVWKPEDFEDGIIDYTLVDEEMNAVLQRFPSMQKFTFDQWNSAYSLSSLSKKHPRIRIAEVTATETVNQQRYEKFKRILNLNWLHSYKDDFFDKDAGISLLENEFKFLSEHNGKVVKQDTGPVTTKDLSDCVVEITVRLLDEQLNRWSGIMNGLSLHAAESTSQVISRATTAGKVEKLSASEARERMNSIASRRPMVPGIGRGIRR